MHTPLKSSLLVAVIATTLVLPGIALAWAPGGSHTQITGVVIGEDAGVNSRALISTAGGLSCSLDVSTPHGKAVLSVIMSAYLAKRTLTLYCQDGTESAFGVPTHRFYQLNLE